MGTFTKCECLQCNPPKEMHEDDILPCPWCGERKIEVENVGTNLTPRYQAKCSQCGAGASPDNLDGECAMDAWNDRVHINKLGLAE